MRLWREDKRRGATACQLVWGEGRGPPQIRYRRTRNIIIVNLGPVLTQCLFSKNIGSYSHPVVFEE